MTTPASQPSPIEAVTKVPAPVKVSAAQPIKVIVEKMPEEKHDYVGDFVTGGIGLTAALIGAWAGAKATAAMARKQKAADDKERDDVAMQSVIRLINEVYTFTTTYVADVETAEKAKEKSGYVTALLVPYAQYPARLHLQPEDAYRTRRVGGPDLLNMIVDFDTRYNSLVETLVLYRSLRSEAFDKFQHVAVDNTTVTLEAEGENDLRLKADMNSLDHIVKQSREIADTLRVESYHAMVRCMEKYVDYFQVCKSLTLPDLDGKEQVIELRPTKK